jgi:hypothetical protein
LRFIAKFGGLKELLHPSLDDRLALGLTEMDRLVALPIAALRKDLSLVTGAAGGVEQIGAAVRRRAQRAAVPRILGARCIAAQDARALPWLFIVKGIRHA